jgi:WD40 repeat protein
MPCSRSPWLILALGIIATAACTGGAPPPPAAMKIASFDTVNSPRSYVDAVALAPDVTLVATGERAGEVRIWPTAGDPTPVSLASRKEAIAALAFSPDAGLLASIGRAKEGALRLWRRPDMRRPDAGAEWTEVASLPMGRCLALRFDGVGSRLGVLCETEVIIVDVAAVQEILRVPNQHREVMTAFDLSADGRRLMTAGHDGGVTVADAVTAVPVRRFSVARTRRPYAKLPGIDPPEVFAVVVALSPDGSRAAAVTIEGTVYVWDVATGRELFDHADKEAGGPPPGSLRFAADGGLLATAGDRYGMRHIDVRRKRSNDLTAGPKAYAAVAITDSGSAFAAATSATIGSRLTYAVEVWRIDAPRTVTAAGPGR